MEEHKPRPLDLRYLVQGASNTLLACVKKDIQIMFTHRSSSHMICLMLPIVACRKLDVAVSEENYEAAAGCVAPSSFLGRNSQAVYLRRSLLFSGIQHSV